MATSFVVRVEFSLVRLEFGLCRQIFRLSVGQLGTEDLQQRLASPHPVAELNEHSRDTAGDERRHDDLLVGIWFDGARDSHGRRPGGAARHRSQLDARSFRSPVATTSQSTSGSGSPEGRLPVSPCDGVFPIDIAFGDAAVSGAGGREPENRTMHRYVVPPAPTASSAITAAATTGHRSVSRELLFIGRLQVPALGRCVLRYASRSALLYRVFEIEIAALLGQHVEDGGASRARTSGSRHPDSAGPDREPRLL